MSDTLYEHYDDDDNDLILDASSKKAAQTFTPATSHTITSVKLRLWAVGAPRGAMAVYVCGLDGEGKPDSAHPMTTGGSIDAAGVGFSSPGSLYEATFSGTANLTADTQYAVVIDAPDTVCDAENYICVRMDADAPSYNGGSAFFYEGDGWNAPDADLTFYEYGTSAGGQTIELTDNIGLLETKKFAIGETRTDLLGLLESKKIDLANTKTDSIGCLESKKMDVAMARSDLLGGLESKTMNLAMTRTDNIGGVDLKAFTVTMAKTDNLGLYDTRLFNLSKILSDAIGLTDQMAKKDLTKVLGDLLGLKDDYTLPGMQTMELTDILGLVDSKTMSLTKLLADMIGCQDQRSIAIAMSLADLLGMTDTYEFAAAASYLELMASIGLVDAKSINLQMILSDIVGAEDSKKLALSLLLVDILGMADALNFPVLWSTAHTVYSRKAGHVSMTKKTVFDARTHNDHSITSK